MHIPSSERRPSVFYDYKIRAYRRPEKPTAERPANPVVIVGAGPIGLATAVDLARFGVPCVILEEDLQVSEGSRAIVLTRRSVEILQQLGVEAPFLKKGLPWSQGRSFFRGREVYTMLMPHDADDRYLPGLNIQQQFIEEYLISHCDAPSLIDIRWGQRVVHRRIDAVLSMIGHPVGWRLDWATVYSANTLTLDNYRHGRILLTGDAAHLLPIFGVRGVNTGLQDCNNMAWKLAFVVNGWANPDILDSYSHERVQAAREICEEGGKSTRFMTPPTAGSRLLRDAVLSFSLSEDFPKDLMHWRTSRPHDYWNSPLNSYPEADREFRDGIACGQPMRNVRLGADEFLFDRIGSGAGFHLMIFAGEAGLTSDLQEILAAVAKHPYPIHPLIVRPDDAPAHGAGPATVAEPSTVPDVEQRISLKYGAAAGTVYLIRPDLHVCARWRRATPGQVLHALRRALGFDAAALGFDAARERS